MYDHMHVLVKHKKEFYGWLMDVAFVHIDQSTIKNRTRARVVYNDEILHYRKKKLNESTKKKSPLRNGRVRGGLWVQKMADKKIL